MCFVGQISVQNPRFCTKQISRVYGYYGVEVQALLQSLFCTCQCNYVTRFLTICYTPMFCPVTSFFLSIFLLPLPSCPLFLVPVSCSIPLSWASVSQVSEPSFEFVPLLLSSLLALQEHQDMMLYMLLFVLEWLIPVPLGARAPIGHGLPPFTFWSSSFIFWMSSFNSHRSWISLSSTCDLILVSSFLPMTSSLLLTASVPISIIATQQPFGPKVYSATFFEKIIRENYRFQPYASLFCKMYIFELSFWHPQAGFNSQKLDDWWKLEIPIFK